MIERKTHDVAAGAGTRNCLEAGSFKQADEAHETVARRTGIDRIGFKNFATLAARVGNGGVELYLARAFAAKIAADEKAGERPHCVRGIAKIVRPAKWAIGRARGNRAPRDRFIGKIAEEANRYAIANARIDRCLAVVAVCRLRLGSGSSPNHAPTAFRPATRSEQSLE